jgi:DNA-binding CsgD family transcriptional regulator
MYINKINSNREENSFLSLIDRIDSIKQKCGLGEALHDLRNKYSVKNASYVGNNMGSLTQNAPFFSVTYSDDWVKHYLANSYFDVDPVPKSLNKSILPLDWQSFDLRNLKVRKFFMEAREAGVGQNGISVPVRGRNQDFGILSITTDLEEADWIEFKRQYMRDIQVLAVHFHQSVLISNGVTEPNFKLSDREIEVLYWAACGKTGEEAGLILGISKRGVRFHVCNIMHKLNCTNITHAVAKAVYFNLINSPK